MIDAFALDGLPLAHTECARRKPSLPFDEAAEVVVVLLHDQLLEAVSRQAAASRRRPPFFHGRCPDRDDWRCSITKNYAGPPESPNPSDFSPAVPLACDENALGELVGHPPSLLFAFFYFSI